MLQLAHSIRGSPFLQSTNPGLCSTVRLLKKGVCVWTRVVHTYVIQGLTV